MHRADRATAALDLQGAGGDAIRAADGAGAALAGDDRSPERLLEPTTDRPAPPARRVA
jgi:hypothetical protein